MSEQRIRLGKKIERIGTAGAYYVLISFFGTLILAVLIAAVLRPFGFFPPEQENLLDGLICCPYGLLFLGFAALWLVGRGIQRSP